MSLVCIHNLSISLDGFATGEGQALDTPFGHAGHRLHERMLATRFDRDEALGESGVTEGVDHVMADRHGPGIGAEIMGAGKFGPPGWQDDQDWRGWWGDDPLAGGRPSCARSATSRTSPDPGPMRCLRGVIHEHARLLPA